MRQAVTLLIVVLALYPLLWMLGSSFKSPEEVLSPGLLPRYFTLDNYIQGWTTLQYDFARYFSNSFLIALLSVIGTLISCSMAAYALSRIEFPGRRVVIALVLVTMMLPYHVVLIPQYVMFSSLGWLNTFLPLTLPKFLATEAFFVFLMMQFFRGLPHEIDEAARLDGCGPVAIYWRMVLPLSIPAIATTAVFQFIWSWNDFLTPLLYLLDPAIQTVPVALGQFLDSTGQSSFGPLFAMSMLSLGPVLGVMIMAQRYLVNGIARTGLK